VSVVNLLEIAAKHGTGRRSAPTISATQLLQLVENSDFSMLPVLPEHAVAVERLPNLHGDPFDRLLVAQAMVEDLRLITHDERVAAYDRTIILF
jgi:PIN domain nuclease of toxin-antitoxin system